MSSRHPLGAQSSLVLTQGARVLHAIDDATYVAAPRGMESRSSFGAHVRHVWDAYDRFFEGLRTGDVDYDARKREERLETDREYAISAAGCCVDS